MEITLYALANYNHGRLIAKTFELADYRDHDEYREAVSEWLGTVPYPCEPGRFEEEWIVADYEYIPEQFVGEYDLYREFWDYYDLRRNISADQLEAFDIFYNVFNRGDDLPDFNEVYIGYFETKTDFVDHWFTEVEGLKVFPPVGMRLYYEGTEREICLTSNIYEEGRHFFRD